LEANKFTTLVANNGREAVDIVNDVNTGPIDAILMDLRMPVMDGITATREIRKVFNASILPIIVLSAETTSIMQEMAADAGANKFFAKPVEMPVLLSYLEEINYLKSQTKMTTNPLIV
jgi:CheY-like chemotaxis protein